MQMFRLMIIIVGLFIQSISWAESNIGKITQLEGSATVIHHAGKTQTLKIGDSIDEGDDIYTAANSHLQIHMKDDAYLALRPNSRLRIDNYHVATVEDSRSILTLFKGSLRAVTGWVGKANAAQYRVNTPSATLGVRGTDYETVVIAEDEATAEHPAGTYDTVYEGQVFIESAGETLDLQPNVSAFVAFGHKPRLLAHLPAFLQKRPPLDERLEAIKPKLQQHIQEKLKQFQEIKQRLQQRSQQLREQLPHPAFIQRRLLP